MQLCFTLIIITARRIAINAFQRLAIENLIFWATLGNQYKGYTIIKKIINLLSFIQNLNDSTISFAGVVNITAFPSRVRSVSFAGAIG